jgi:hypothetical protein
MLIISRYGNAFCTIIAACGQQANHMLSGLLPRTKLQFPPTETVKPGVEYAAVPHGDILLPEATYTSRGWT